MHVIRCLLDNDTNERSNVHETVDKMNPQAESVIKNIIREICLECNSQGQSVSETLAAFMVSQFNNR